MRILDVAKAVFAIITGALLISAIAFLFRHNEAADNFETGMLRLLMSSISFAFYATFEAFQIIIKKLEK